MPSLPRNATQPESRAAWRKWLTENHAQTEGVWLVSYKKATGKPRVEYKDSVLEAICFGWIDSKVNKLDAERSMLWFAPRKAKTGWSKPNKQRVAQAIAEGLMQPAGLKKIEQAKADGSWNSLDGVEELEVPSDLRTALDTYPNAAAHFAAFPRSVKRGILEWILVARKPETRANRINETARLASENIRANQWRPKGAP